MMPYPFDCPNCDKRYWDESSVIDDKIYGDSICWQCAEEFEVERKDAAGCDIGDCQ